MYYTVDPSLCARSRLFDIDSAVGRVVTALLTEAEPEEELSKLSELDVVLVVVPPETCTVEVVKCLKSEPFEASTL